MRLTIPNQLTLLRVLLTPVFVYYFSFDQYESRLLGAIIFIIAALTDWYDGMIARRFGVITRFGQFADPLADKILVLSALILFAVLDYVRWWMVIIISFRDILLTVMRIYSIKKGMPIVTHLVAKWKTFLQMGFIIILIIFYTIASYLYYPLPDYLHHIFWVDSGLFVIVLITIYSLIAYVKENFQLILKFVQEIF